MILSSAQHQCHCRHTRPFTQSRQVYRATVRCHSNNVATGHVTEAQVVQPDAVLSRRSCHVAVLGMAAALAGQVQSPLPAVAKPEPGDWSQVGLQAPEDPNLPKFYKTDTGVKVQEIVVGSGPAVENGDRVLIDYVLRRPNGYFIYSSVEGVSFQPRDVPVGPVSFVLGQDASWIAGLQEVVSRMRQGGKVRALIPPSQGYFDCNKDQPQPPTFATKRQLVNHCKEPLLFEVALLRVTKP